MLPFDVVLFDIGGVLLTNSWDVKERAETAAHFHIDENELQSRHAHIVELWERGGLTLGTYLDVAVFYEARQFTRDEFIASMLSHSKSLPNGAMKILHELAATGKYLMGALNNESRELNDYRLKAFGLRSCFDMQLSSCYLGLRKPDGAIYQRAIDIVGKLPKRILFVDDRPENVAGAKAAGITAIRFTDEATLRNDLARLSES
jgi:putative hydrolase of the HAD superfamily